MGSPFLKQKTWQLDVIIDGILNHGDRFFEYIFLIVGFRSKIYERLLVLICFLMLICTENFLFLSLSW